jgi:hypothetical protein
MAARLRKEWFTMDADGQYLLEQRIAAVEPMVIGKAMMGIGSQYSEERSR